MKKPSKRLTAAILAAVMTTTVAAMGLTNAAATRNPDDTYTPSAGVKTKTYKFAMPGCWESDYWINNENCAGIYWWTGSDAPYTAFMQDYPGYRVNRDTSEAGVENLYSTPVPADARQIIFNNHIDGGLPGTEGFSQERFDAACQIVDTAAQYYSFMESDYYTKELWTYVWDKAADAVEMEHVDWDMSVNRMTNDETDQVAAIYEALLDEKTELDIPEFGDYANNFFVDMENDDGIGLSFDNMVYVVNLDPNTAKISTVIVPEGQITYDGEWMFYYGNGEYGIWPTKELLLEHTGMTLDADGSLILPEDSGLETDYYGTVNRVVDGKRLMVYGNFTVKYYYDKTYPHPSTDKNKIYFEVVPGLWKNFKTITLYLYEHGGNPIIAWGSKKGNMTDEGNNIWSYDFDAKGITIDPDKQYGMIFTADWNAQTCDIIFDASIMGDTAYCTGQTTESPVDSGRRDYVARWKNADPDRYGQPVTITPIGNLIGTAYWKNDTPYSLMLHFLQSDGRDGLANALQYNGKTEQETIDDLANALGLSVDDVEKAIRESGKTIDWNERDSTIEGAYPYSEGAVTIADYIEAYYDNPRMTTPAQIQMLFDNYGVTKDEVREIIYKHNHDFETFDRMMKLIDGAQENVTLIKGDVNGDGVVDVTDATFIQLKIAGYDVF